MYKDDISGCEPPIKTCVTDHATPDPAPPPLTNLVQHPHPQRQAGEPTQTDAIGPDGVPITTITTCQGYFPETDPFSCPPGSNLLPTVYTNVFDSCGNEMCNTLPSTPAEPYHLHDGDPVIATIDSTSPTDDLFELFNHLASHLTGRSARHHWANYSDCSCSQMSDTGTPLPPGLINKEHVKAHMQRAIDILEGNTLADRVYSGLPILHYQGHRKVKSVTPIENGAGTIIGGNVNVHQICYDSHIESDTAFLDFEQFRKTDGTLYHIPWTITYTIDVLNRGKDDFSPMTMYFDHPNANVPKLDCEGNPLSGDSTVREDGGVPQASQEWSAQRQYAMETPSGELKTPVLHVAMDQTFFPVAVGTRTVLKIKMPPPVYYSLTYSWGWRQHPPRVQVMENAGKKFPPVQVPGGETPKPLPEYEREVFDRPKEQAIGKLSDLAPEKRMWNAFRKGLQVIQNPCPDYASALAELKKAWCAFLQWRDRNHLPSGVKVDPDTDITLFYANNTIYGELSDGGLVDFPQWRTRRSDLRPPGAELKVTLINGDYFEHGYLSIDSGGYRGWENQFKSSIKVGGTGSRFSFGRFYYSMNMKKPIVLPKAKGCGDSTIPSRHKVFFKLNYEPSRRLRMYQFDPLHHDVAIYSLH